MENRRINARLDHARLALGTLFELLGELTAAIVAIPIVGRRRNQPFRLIQPQGMYIADHKRQCHQALPLLNQAEIGGLLDGRSEEHTSELQSLMRNSYAVFCLKKKNTTIT